MPFEPAGLPTYFPKPLRLPLGTKNTSNTADLIQDASLPQQFESLALAINHTALAFL